MKPPREFSINGHSLTDDQNYALGNALYNKFCRLRELHKSALDKDTQNAALIRSTTLDEIMAIGFDKQTKPTG